MQLQFFYFQGALLGQMCFQREQVVLYFAANIHLLVNTGYEVISSDQNMLSTVAFQLGPDKPLLYALEGLLPGSGSSVEWLNQLTNGGSAGCGTDNQNPMQLLTLLNSSQHSESVYCSPSPSTICGTPPQLSIADQPSVATSTTQFKTAAAYGPLTQLNAANSFRNRRHNIFFVPARDKVILPGCGIAEVNPSGSGLIYGVTKDTSAADLQQAAYEGICFQVKQLLQAVQKDCKSWRPVKKVTVGGELIEANSGRLAQTLADFCDLVVEYPQAEAVCSLGAMIAAGLAANVFTIESLRESMVPPTTIFQRSLRLTETEGKFRRWVALQQAIGEVSDGEHSDEEDGLVDDGKQRRGSGGTRFIVASSAIGNEERYKDPLYNVHRSIPGSLFATIAFATLLAAEWWQKVSAN